jgi:7-carboxy-7-deazaguanine synthase
MSISKIITKVKKYNCNLVEITGGEPLLQENCIELIKELERMNKKVLIETGGALSIKNISKKTHIILDIKCPSSNMSDKNLWDNFNYIKKSDEIKFVIGNKKDYAWTKNIISKYQLNKKCFILISPVHDIFCPSIIFFIPNYKFDFIAFLNIIKIVP